MLTRFAKKIVSKIGVLGVVLLATAILAVGGYAAWQVTKQASTTAMVMSTFTVADLVCEPTLDGEPGLCTALVTNTTPGAMNVEQLVALADNPNVTFPTVLGAKYKLDGSPVVVVVNDGPVAAGATGEITFHWQPSGIAELTEVNITLDVTAEQG